MTNHQKDSLFVLIKALSKSEKRQFKLYVGRLGVNTDSKFLTLFNLMDKMNEYDEKLILQKAIVKKSQLSNLKAHLYKQVLISLRLNPVNQDSRVLIREQMDFASILYNKGLYKQSLKILEKAKSVAIETQQKSPASEIVELEKIIESQYITRSILSRADQLIKESTDLLESNALSSQLSNLSLQLYKIILQSGYVKNNEEFHQISKIFYAQLPKTIPDHLDFREQLWWNKAHLWYSLLVQDFLGAYKYASKWVGLFYDHPKMISLHPVFFLKGNHYLLEALFFLKYKTKFRETLDQLNTTIETDLFPLNDNTDSLGFLYCYQHKLNWVFLTADFDRGLEEAERVMNLIKKYKERLDSHHIMIFYYKVACIYFGTGDFKNCIKHLNLIIHNKNLKIREDLNCFARVLSLVAHYESGMDYHLEIQLKTTYKFLLKMNELQKVQVEFIKFLRGLGKLYPNELKEAFVRLHTELKKYEEDPYEKRAFLYLDIISWLESKIENVPLQAIIKKKSEVLAR